MVTKTTVNNVKYRFLEKCSGDMLQALNCVNWQGSINSDGYGNFRLFGRVVNTNRAAYELFIGEIPLNMHVLHTCDNRRCVNPAHLWVGDNADNMLDRNKKDRDAHKVTAEQVREIRADMRTQRAIAVDYGIGQDQISRIKSGLRRGIVS